MSSLNAKELHFVREYLVDKNATRSAKAAGFAVSTAEKKAPMWVAESRAKSTKPHVWDAVQEGMKALVEKVDVRAEAVLREYMNIGFANVGMIASWEGSSVTLKDSEKLSEQAMQAVSEVSQGRFGVKVKMHSKTAALDALAKHTGILKNDGVSVNAVFDFNLTGEPDDGG